MARTLRAVSVDVDQMAREVRAATFTLIKMARMTRAVLKHNFMMARMIRAVVFAVKTSAGEANGMTTRPYENGNVLDGAFYEPEASATVKSSRKSGQSVDGGALTVGGAECG